MVWKFGIDGRVEVEYPEATDCCPPDVCSISVDQLSCNFVNLLPSGPLWDRDKRDWQNTDQLSRTSLVRVAVLLANVMHDQIKNSLWPAVRETYARTASTTLEDWLTRLNWVDCYGACRNPALTVLSPLEVMGPCGPVYCDPQLSDDYKAAFNKGLVQALIRFSRRPLATLDSLNSILEPLGVQATAGDIQGNKPNQCDGGQFCVTLNVSADELPIPILECGEIQRYVPTRVEIGCNAPAGVPQEVWPTLLAAECITRSFLPSKKLCVIQNPCEKMSGLAQLN